MNKASNHHTFDSIRDAATALAKALGHEIRALLHTHDRVVFALPGGITGQRAINAVHDKNPPDN